MCQALPKIFEIQCKLVFKELEIFIAPNLHIKLRSPAISFAPLAQGVFVNDVSFWWIFENFEKSILSRKKLDILLGNLFFTTDEPYKPSSILKIR